MSKYKVTLSVAVDGLPGTVTADVIASTPEHARDTLANDSRIGGSGFVVDRCDYTAEQIDD
ncbi:hypothetical protein [Streptomyces formicae]|uniref:Uncharacterized protein n=1 Tax=Streptomyces formicae TaxID=1616117 RepID=A0A291Q718_9ACTN|nr:hypothetical protein [Streptomyces formicae]ATL27580.1 hypothetical protein KY5_2562 [Streptomyces formicae]